MNALRDGNDREDGTPCTLLGRPGHRRHLLDKAFGAVRVRRGDRACSTGPAETSDGGFSMERL